MGPGAAFISAGIGALAGALGQRSERRFNSREAQKSRDFSAQMRNTQWQAAVEDMRQAGLNPALAYSAGPNAAPGGGASASTSGNPISSAMQAARFSKELSLLSAQERHAKAQAVSAESQSKLDKDRQEYLSPTVKMTANGRTVPPLLYDLIDSEISTARAGATNMAAMAARNNELYRISRPLGDMMEKAGIPLTLMGMLLGGGGIGGVAGLLRRKGKSAAGAVGAVTDRIGRRSDIGKRFSRPPQRRRR